jgi:hypothetical protein
MAVRDVWVELRSKEAGPRLVRADTIEQVGWHTERPAFLTVTVCGGQEVLHDVRAGLPIDDLEEDEAADLCTGLAERIALASSLQDGGGMVWMARDDDIKGVGSRHGPLIERSAR